jgi:hypothetical protein
VAVKLAGVEPMMHDCRGWVWGILGFIRPKKFAQAELEDAEGYLQKLAMAGKEIWQLKQADEALKIFYQEADHGRRTGRPT